MWASLRYGLFPIGLNQAGFNRIIATVCSQLRKVLRIHEHGVSNQQILQQADLNPLQFLLESGEKLIERVDSDTSRSWETLYIEKTVAEENLKVLQAVCSEQPRSNLVEADPFSVAGGYVCSTCGLAFASEEGRTMRIKRKHTEVHLQAGVEFNRGLHSLFGHLFVDYVAGTCSTGERYANASRQARVPD